MRRFLVVIWMIGATGACVNLSKPEQVAECAKDNTCVNSSPVDGGGAPADTKKDTGLLSGDGQGPAATDAISATDDVAPVVDAGELPDLPFSDTPEPIVEDGGSLPDLPWVLVDGGNPDVPILPDGPADGPPVVPDVRDANRDVAAGICVANGVLKPVGTMCRAAVGGCDIEETCDGLNADCPADKLQPAGKECRATSGDCDIAETCSGTSSDCPADGFKQAGTVCRAANGLCDYAEICSGDSADCPSDLLKQSSAVCRDATNVCDPAENCTGLSASCPQDVPPYTRPVAPTSVTTTPGELQGTIEWSTVSGATGYNVKRSTTAGGPYNTIATGVVASLYVDTNLDSTKIYYYVISAINTIASCESVTNSPEASVQPTGVCTPPLAPTVTAVAGNGRITLSWGAVSGATAYAIDRSEASGTGYSSLASVTSTTTSYVDLAVVFGKTYYYRVTSKGTCDSDPSTEVSTAPLCTPTATAPTGLSATTPNTGGLVVLTWNAVSGAKTTDRYYIMRKPSTGTTYLKIDEVVPPTITYSDTTAANGTSYDYAVTYYNGTCTSSNSNVKTATAACVMDKPVLTVTPGNKKVDLSWTAPANGSLTGYKLYRKDTGSYSLIATLTGAGSRTYSDTGLTNNTTYTYYVTAVGNCNADSAAKTVAPVCTPLTAPTNLSATAGDTQVTLNWDAVTGADHYTVKRGTVDGGPYTALVPTLPIATNSYTDTGLTDGTTYYNVVSVSNGSCDSVNNSNQATATPQMCPSQGVPGKPTLSITSNTQVQVDWTAATPAPSGGYNIMRSTSSTGTYSSIHNVSIPPLTFTDPASGLTVGTTYYYEIAAIGTSCSATSASSSIALTCSNPDKPSPTITANANGSIALGGVLLSNGATAYTVSRSDDGGTTYAVISSNQTTTTYTDPTSLTNTNIYFYKVTATNAAGQCATASDPVSIRSCIIPLAPTSVTATRTGNNRVTLAWTNSTSAQSYYIQRSDGFSVRATSGSPYVDTAAANATAYSYALSAASDTAGLCTSGNSTPSAAVLSCTVMAAGTTAYGITPQSKSAYCFVTCYDLQGINSSNEDGRTLSINGSTMNCPVNGNCTPPTLALPPKNGGYVFQLSACPSSGTCYQYPMNTWWGTSNSCP